MTPERYQRIINILNRRQHDLCVLTDDVHKGRNLSAIMRNCDAAGVLELHSVATCTRTFKGTAKGSHRWVNWIRHKSMEDALHHFKRQGFQLIAADPDDQARDFHELDYTLPTVLVLGNEKNGISQQARTHIDHYIKIPMLGMVESLNVSVASGVILFEAQKQRMKAGMYRRCRLPAHLYERTRFEWCHPTVATYCQKHGLNYPDLNDQGDIIEAAQWLQKVPR